MSNVATSPLAGADALTPERNALVRAHLEEILASRTLAGSKRTQAFLRFIVERALEGDLDALHERVIGAELFGRPISYDTGNDSVVRVRASEVRKKLSKYYGNEAKDRPSPVRIELLSGSYVPRFHFEDKKANAAAPPDSAPASGPTEAVPEKFAPVARKSSTRTRILIWTLPVVLILAAFVVFLTVRHQHASPAIPKDIHSIAVLPLQNLSGDPAQDYFVDGLTEELINDLGQVSTLRVISYTSSMSFKGTQKKLPEIAKELAVDAVVEGGVLRDGNQVRVSAQLIDARTDRPLWASSYVQDVTNVFAWQGEIAQEIAEEISTRVTPQEQARLAQKHSVDPEAQDDYLHGLLLRNADNCMRGIDYFQRAIQKSPDYAQAHSALASCYGMLGESGQMPYDEAFTRQKSEAILAINLDGSLSEAHAELANTAMTLDWNWSAAAAEFNRALALNPNSAPNHEKYAFYLVRTGHPAAAIEQIEQSVNLDPVSASTFHSEGFIYYFAHQYDQALKVARMVQGLDLNLSDWNFLLGDIYAAKGMYPESIRAFLKSGNGPYSLGHLGNVYARDGRPADAMKIIRQLETDVQTNGIGRYEIALIYAGLGDKDQAFQWLDDAYRAHDVGLVYLKVDPCLDPLRSDPRFGDLLQRTGLGTQ